MVKAPALRPVGDGSYAKKKCPRCGELLFADMTKCYGCLYDFTKVERPTGVSEGVDELEELEGLAAGTPCALPQVDAPSSSIEPPIARREADDEATTVLDDRSRGRRPHGVWVRSAAVDVFVPLGPDGLSVGRGAGNQVVLHERSVSRRHLRLSPTDSGRGIEVVDLGATNPATVDGEPITSSAFVPWGEEVRVGGALLAACE